MANPTVIELFAGAGIFGSAFHAERFRMIFAIEINEIAAKTYRLNLGDHIVCSDIKQVAPKGRADVLIAGPPCQGYSSLGKRNVSDPRNKLSLETLRWVDATKPSVVVIENVPLFLKSKESQAIRIHLERKGYQVSEHVLNAFDFGVPQLRSRAILFASKIGGLEIVKPRKLIRSVRDAWRGISEVPDGKNRHDFRRPSKLALERMEWIPNGGDKRDLLSLRPDLCPPSWIKTPKEVTDVWGRMKWDGPANTLRTCFLNPSKGRYIHPEQNRVITIREGARIHTIPDSYQFVGTDYQVAKQIGNSVPYTLGRFIAKSVRRCFD